MSNIISLSFLHSEPFNLFWYLSPFSFYSPYFMMDKAPSWLNWNKEFGIRLSPLSIMSLLMGLHIWLWEVNLMILNSKRYIEWLTSSCLWEIESHSYYIILCGKSVISLVKYLRAGSPYIKLNHWKLNILFTSLSMGCI